jgi:AAA+ superfamily predicted ATPase
MPENSKDVAGDIAALLRARNGLLWIVTREEARVEGYLMESAASAGFLPRCWDVSAGITDMAGKPAREFPDTQDPGSALAVITTRATRTVNSDAERGVWIMRDLPPWLIGPAGMTTCRQVRNLARLLPTVPRNCAQALIILTPNAEVPPELAGHATVIEWPLPDRAEIARLLDAAIEALPDDLKESAAPNGTRDAAIDAAVGLAGEEASACYARSLVQLRRIDPATVAKEKRRIIARERVLEWIEPIQGGLEAVGGLDLLKGWLVSRRAAYSASARSYGLPAPKGALLVGPPGTGKSLVAKAIATAWGVPLLKLDLGALKSKFVGDSEANIRKAFRVIEAIGRCVVFLDEIEKALAGATQGAADGGVSGDALGSILGWMQDRAGSAFVVMTANDATQLPPELMRAGRLDAVWSLDLPNPTERGEILKVSLRVHGREAVDVYYADVIDATEGFTGSEIAALVPNALYAAFAENEREITTDDLLEAARTVVPLSKTASEKIETLRQWANARARPATTPQKQDAGAKARARAIDL